MATPSHSTPDPGSHLPIAALHRIAAAHPYPLLFATISGAHLYGFPSPDSDFDLRGAHVLPVETVLGLHVHDETVESSKVWHETSAPDDQGVTHAVQLEMDIVSHDIKKFFGLLLRKNGYVLEQLYSPLIVHTTAEHLALKRVAHGCVTRYHSHHYFGFAETQWKLFYKDQPRRVKPLLYVYRILLTGIHLMRTGEVEANLGVLNETSKLSHVKDLMDRKKVGENITLEDGDVEFHHREYLRLRGELQTAHEVSSLPDAPSTLARDGLNELLIQVRLGE